MKRLAQKTPGSPAFPTVAWSSCSPSPIPRSNWDLAAIRAADHLIWKASALRAPGSFELEGAIQSAHCQLAFPGRMPWKTIANPCGVLMTHAPTLAAILGHAAAPCKASCPPQGLES